MVEAGLLESEDRAAARRWDHQSEARDLTSAHDRIDRLTGARADESYGDAAMARPRRCRATPLPRLDRQEQLSRVIAVPDPSVRHPRRVGQPMPPAA